MLANNNEGKAMKESQHLIGLKENSLGSRNKNTILMKVQLCR